MAIRVLVGSSTGPEDRAPSPEEMHVRLFDPYDLISQGLHTKKVKIEKREDKRAWGLVKNSMSAIRYDLLVTGVSVERMLTGTEKMQSSYDSRISLALMADTQCFVTTLKSMMDRMASAIVGMLQLWDDSMHWLPSKGSLEKLMKVVVDRPEGARVSDLRDLLAKNRDQYAEFRKLRVAIEHEGKDVIIAAGGKVMLPLRKESSDDSGYTVKSLVGFANESLALALRLMNGGGETVCGVLGRTCGPVPRASRVHNVFMPAIHDLLGRGGSSASA